MFGGDTAQNPYLCGMKKFQTHISQAAEESSLFSKIELYRMSHDECGREYDCQYMKRKQKYMRFYQNLHLRNGLRFTEKNGFPIMQPYDGPIDFHFISFTSRLRHSGDGEALHFFMDDYKFESLLDNRFDLVTMQISKFNIVMAPDFSLYSDAPELFVKTAIYKRQLYGACWQQKCGLNVIPVAGVPRADALEYAFEGTPENSIIGYCGAGHHISKSAYDLWIGGLYELEARRNPKMILIYGKEEKIPGLNTPVIFIPDHISQNLRTLKHK